MTDNQDRLPFKSPNVSVSVDRDLLSGVQARARKNGMALGTAVDQALEEWLNRQAIEDLYGQIIDDTVSDETGEAFFATVEMSYDGAGFYVRVDDLTRVSGEQTFTTREAWDEFWKEYQQDD